VPCDNAAGGSSAAARVNPHSARGPGATPGQSGGTRLDNRVTGPAGPSWPAGKRPSWPRATAQLATGHGPASRFMPGPGARYVASSSMHYGPRATAELELQLAQLGPANVAGIKKPGHGPGFEWPAGRVYGAAELRAASSHSSSSSSSGMHNAAASSKSPVRMASARSSVK